MKTTNKSTLYRIKANVDLKRLETKIIHCYKNLEKLSSKLKKKFLFTNYLKITY